MTLHRIGPAPRALLVAALFFIAGIFDHLFPYVVVDPVWAYWLSDFVEQTVFGIALLWLIFRLTGWRLRDLGVGWPPGRARFWLLPAMLVGGGAVLVLAAPLTEVLTERIGIAPAVPDYGDAFLYVLPEQQTIRFLAIVYSCTVSGFFEEIFYRGVLWRALVMEGGGHWRYAGYVALSAVLFGLAHTEYGVFGVVSNMLWGAVGALLLLIVRNLWPLVIGHAATNFIEYLPFLVLDAPEPGEP